MNTKICIKCANLLRFDENLQVRAASFEEVAE